MVNHRPNDSDPISVSLEGSGSYSSAALNVVRGEDWFPNFPVVDHVSFVCRSEGSGIPKIPFVIFPTQSELEKGKGATVEIPCTMNAAQVRDAMKKVRRFLQDQRNNPIKTARASRTLAAGCDRNPKATGCAQWKEITDLFTGTAERPLMTAAVYCGVSFGGGVESSQWLKRLPVVASKPAVARTTDYEVEKSRPNGSLGYPLSDKEMEEFRKSQQAVDEWQKKNIPKCKGINGFGDGGGSGGGGMMVGGSVGMIGKAPASSDVKGCREELDRAKAKLKAEGIAFERNGHVTFHGEDCQFKKELACAIAFTLKFAEEGALRAQAIQDAANSAPPTKSELAVLQEQLDRYIDNKVSVVKGWKGSSNLAMRIIPGSVFLPSNCGLDAVCRKQEMIAEKAFNLMGSILEPGCYEISTAEPGGKYGATYTFASLSKEDCTLQFGNPFSN